jgi:hypothetical protein
MGRQPSRSHVSLISVQPHPRARIAEDKIEVAPLRTMHHDRASGRWQTLALLVEEHLPFDLPHAGRNGYIALTPEQAEQLRDVLEFDGHLLPPLLDADRETVAELQKLLEQCNLGDGPTSGQASRDPS